jgi:hypothetical protein
MAGLKQEFSTRTLPTWLKAMSAGEVLLSSLSERLAPWPGFRRVALFESIYAGFPVGTVVAWRRSRLAKEFVYASLPGSQGPYDLVIEGGALLATLFDELAPGLPGSPNEGKVPSDGGLVFNLVQGTIHPLEQGARLRTTWFPLNRLLDASAQHEFQVRLRTLDNGGVLANRFSYFVDAFFDFNIPLITILGDASTAPVQHLAAAQREIWPLPVPPLLVTDRWWCDRCHQVIARSQDGYVEWLMPSPGPQGRRMGKGLRLVHHAPASPLPDGCQYTHAEQRAARSLVHDGALDDFLGDDGLTQLLSLLTEKEVPTIETIELIKRLHTPGYERARLHLPAAIQAGVVEPNLPEGHHWQSDLLAVLRWADQLGLKP